MNRANSCAECHKDGESEPVNDSRFPDSYRTESVLSEVSSRYGVKGLAGGDLKQGLNLLATLCAGAASIADTRVPVQRGADLIASGFSVLSVDEVLNGLIRSRLIGPVRDCQNRFLSTRAFVTTSMKHGAERVAQGESVSPMWHYCGGATGNPNPAKMKQWLSPRVLVAANSRKALIPLLKEVHGARAVVSVTLESRAQAAEFKGIMGELLDGGVTLPEQSGALGMSVVGEVLAMTNEETAREIASLSNAGDWTQQCLWLDASVPNLELDSDDERALDVSERLRVLYDERVGYPPSPPLISMLPVGYLEHWHQQLSEWTGNDRAQMALGQKLFPSIGKGLMRLWPGPRRIPDDVWLWAFHLSKYLLIQSRDVRLNLRHGAELAIVEDAALRILPKMGETPMTVREVSRRCSSMRADLCRTALACLTAAGYLEQLKDKWRIDPRYSPDGDANREVMVENAVFLPTLKGGRFNREFLAQLEMTR